MALRTVNFGRVLDQTFVDDTVDMIEEIACQCDQPYSAQCGMRRHGKRSIRF